MSKILTGDGTYDYMVVMVDGEDITISGTSTWFGGGEDSEDNSIGAGGINTNKFPDLPGIALPMKGKAGQLGGSPVPKLPFNTPCRVYSPKTEKSTWAFLIDIGPSKSTKHAIDVTPPVLEALGLSKEDGLYNLRVRVVGGAKFVK